MRLSSRERAKAYKGTNNGARALPNLANVKVDEKQESLKDSLGCSPHLFNVTRENPISPLMGTQVVS